MKINIIYLFLFLVLLSGCDNGKKLEDKNNIIKDRDLEIEKLLTQNNKVQNNYDSLTYSYIDLAEENAALHEDIAVGMGLIDQIEKNLDKITSLKRPLVYPTDIEKRTKQSNIFSNIKLIEYYIERTEYLIRQLRDSTAMIPHFENYILELTDKLEKREVEVQSLKIQLKKMEKDLGNANQTIDSQEQLIKKLNKKFIIFVSKKESVILEADHNQISIPFKFTAKNILTDHPSRSYTLRRPKGRDVILEIHNKSLFWNEGNYMVVKVNRRELKSL